MYCQFGDRRFFCSCSTALPHCKLMKPFQEKNMTRVLQKGSQGKKLSGFTLVATHSTKVLLGLSGSSALSKKHRVS